MLSGKKQINQVTIMLISVLKKSTITLRYIIALFALIPLTTQLVQAEQKERFGDYEVHYSAFTSTFLTPEIAKQYGIVRSKAIGVINISVLKKSDTGLFEPVPAQLEGIRTNDIQQQQFLAFRRVKEGKAIYYLTEVQFMEGEVLTFNISATPEGQPQPLKLRFSQTFYNEDK